MKACAVLLLLIGAPLAASLKADPLGMGCAGCDETLSQRHQECVSQYGDACRETNEKGLVIAEGEGQGKKKDITCCNKRVKHDKCMKCATQDVSHGTGNTGGGQVDKAYYRWRAKDEEDKTKTKGAYAEHDKKAMKAAGWGL